MCIYIYIYKYMSMNKYIFKSMYKCIYVYIYIVNIWMLIWCTGNRKSASPVQWGFFYCGKFTNCFRGENGISSYRCVGIYGGSTGEQPR
jgi:hypothetical protein